jgi:hypothetical protein
VTFGDGNDSARVLFPDVLAALFGPAVRAPDLAVAIPREDRLLVALAGDPAALMAMADASEDAWEHGERNARFLRIAGGRTTAFEPPRGDPAYERFADIAGVMERKDEELQRQALTAALGDREDTPFVASIKEVENGSTGDRFSFVVHSEAVPTLLPRAEWVVFRHVDLAKQTATTLACGRWDDVRRLMKGRWSETDLWPPRWYAKELPTAAELAKLGCTNAALRMDLGVPRHVDPGGPGEARDPSEPDEPTEP